MRGTVKAAASGALSRTWSSLRPRRNPLIRRVDRFQASLLVLVSFGVALAIPLGVLVGQSTYVAEMHGSVVENRGHHRTTAVMLQNAPPPRHAGEGLGTVVDTAIALARWQTPTGIVHTGRISVPSGSMKGTRVGLWISASGEPVAPASDRSDAAVQGIFSGVTAWLGGTFVLLLGYYAARRHLDRRRSAGWDRAWTRLSH